MTRREVFIAAAVVGALSNETNQQRMKLVAKQNGISFERQLAEDCLRIATELELRLGWQEAE